MNRIVELIRASVTHKDKQPQSKTSKSGGCKRNSGKKSSSRRAGTSQTHFYDPDAREQEGSSSDEMSPAEVYRLQEDTVARIENAEAALAKERKRIEQLEFRRKEAEDREDQRQTQQEEDPGLSPRDKNRRAYERAVARVERNALRKIEELERRFAHSDKVFEMKTAGQGAAINE